MREPQLLRFFGISARVVYLALALVPLVGCVARHSGAQQQEVTVVTAGHAAEIRVLTLSSTTSDIVDLRFLFRSGSVDDPPGAEGITALAAKMLVHGGTQTLSADQLKDTLYPWAVTLNVHTDKEMTVFYARVHRAHLERVLLLLRDLFLHPRWDTPVFERLRSAALEEIRTTLRGGNDEALAKQALQSLLFRNHPYGHPTVGTVQGLAGLSIDQLRRHAIRVFNRRRLTIAVAPGSVDALPDRLANLLAALPDGPNAVEIGSLAGARPAERMGPRVLLVKKQTKAVAVSIGCRVPFDRRSNNFYALRMIGSALGEHRQFIGRLQRSLRTERGLTYGAYAYMEHFEQHGRTTMARLNTGRSAQYLSIWLRPLRPEQAVFGVALAMTEYDRLRRHGLTSAEQHRVAAFLGGYSSQWEQTPQQRLGQLLDDDYYGTPDRLDGLRKALTTLGLSKINRIANELLPPVSELRWVMVCSECDLLRKAIIADAIPKTSYPTAVTDDVNELDAIVRNHRFGVNEQDVQVVQAATMFER